MQLIILLNSQVTNMFSANNEIAEQFSFFNTFKYT